MSHPVDDSANESRRRLNLSVLQTHRVATAAFFAIGLVHIASVANLAYDEVHYIDAARQLAKVGAVTNREHPMFAKEIMALGWFVFGSNFFGLRLIALAVGSAGFFCACRALHLHTRNEAAARLFPLLLISGTLFVGLSALAQTDVFAASLVAISLYLHTRGHLLQSATALGLALACKWSVAPLAVLLCAAQLTNLRKAITFAVVALGTYLTTFLPLLLTWKDPVGLFDLPNLHLAMHATLAADLGPPDYPSQWWEWLYGGGAVRLVNGDLALRLNPVLALPSVVAVLYFRDRFVSLCAISCFLLIALSGKPGLMLHQFLLPHIFALAALALAVPDRLSRLAAGLAAASFVATAMLPLPPVMPRKPRTAEQMARGVRLQACLDHPANCKSIPPD